MYKYEFKCTSIKHNIWYQFENHKWNPVDQGITLRNKIGNELVREYLRVISYYANQASEEEDDCNLTIVKIFLGKHSESKIDPPILYPLNPIMWHGEKKTH